MERTSGVLMHISSLPNTYGIGTFGKTAFDFVDFLVETGQTYWQILPLTTTSYGDSPYQSFSAFAGNTHFIDFDVLIEEEVLTAKDLEDKNFGDDPKKVDYHRIFNERRPLLDKAVANFVENEGLENKEFSEFIENNEIWLEPFVQYMTIKEGQGLRAWYEWPEKYKQYDKEVVLDYCENHEDVVNYHRVTQYWFFKQWTALKDYANENHIQIIGDIPIYVSRDSVEMWMTPELFLVDEYGNPTGVAGVPPDSFSADGQYWGNPIYDWEYMEENDYEWWVLRMEESFKLYDVVRIDHFRGFESFWEVPYGSKTAATGEWKPGPSNRLFEQIEKELGKLNVIAEDLGFITKEVVEMRDKTGYPGMRILQNGFYGQDNIDLPHHYIPNTVAYVGTHDNRTALDWYLNQATLEERDQMDLYLNRRPGEHVSDALNRGIAASPSYIAVYMMQDLLQLGEESRMNIPSTVGDNWDWRMEEQAITPDVKEKLLQWTETYFRLNESLLEEEDIYPDEEVEVYETEESLEERTDTLQKQTIKNNSTRGEKND